MGPWSVAGRRTAGNLRFPRHLAAATVSRMSQVAVAMVVILASATIAVVGFFVSLMRSRSRRIAATGAATMTDYGLVLLVIGLAGLISGLGMIVFLLLPS